MKISDSRALQSLITKYKTNPVKEVVFKLSYGGCYIIIKAADLAGALYRFKRDYGTGEKPSESAISGIYGPFYAWIGECTESGVRAKFGLKILCQVGAHLPDFPNQTDPIVLAEPIITTQYHLLVYEQLLLMGAETDSACLNKNYETYIPKWNPNSQMYGWFTKGEVINFKKWKNGQEKTVSKKL